MIDKSTSQFLAARPGLKYIFFGGKGGVGKTVMAGAAALHFAEQGRKTLLASGARKINSMAVLPFFPFPMIVAFPFPFWSML